MISKEKILANKRRREGIEKRAQEREDLKPKVDFRREMAGALSKLLASVDEFDRDGK